MSRRAVLVVLAAAAGVTAATVSYAVLRLPEPGESRQAGVPFAQWWAENRSLPITSLSEPCATGNENKDDRTWCFRQQVEEARREWRRSQSGMTEVWLASDLSSKRHLYLVIGAYVLFAFTVGLLTVRTVARLV